MRLCRPDPRALPGDDGPRGARGVIGPTGLKGFPGAVVRVNFVPRVFFSNVDNNTLRMCDCAETHVLNVNVRNILKLLFLRRFDSCYMCKLFAKYFVG